MSTTAVASTARGQSVKVVPHTLNLTGFAGGKCWCYRFVDRKPLLGLRIRYMLCLAQGHSAYLGNHLINPSCSAKDALWAAISCNES